MHFIKDKEFENGNFQQLLAFIKQERASGKNIFPPESLVFNALELISDNPINVVILGQDPYHGAGQANGLAFSVNKGVKIPPSLRNIFKELNDDLGIPIPDHGDLSNWAKQGVLLLNAVLTVEEGKPGSHQNKGWEKFTDELIKRICAENSGVVFLLWGNYAKSKAKLIDANKHLVLESAHPSPLSAYQGFFQCKHFSKTNNFLISIGKKTIDWHPH